MSFLRAKNFLGAMCKEIKATPYGKRKEEEEEDYFQAPSTHVPFLYQYTVFSARSDGQRDGAPSPLNISTAAYDIGLTMFLTAEPRMIAKFGPKDGACSGWTLRSPELIPRDFSFYSFSSVYSDMRDRIQKAVAAIIREMLTEHERN